NFQIFFISNTGQTPEKIGTDIGRSLYIPPPKIHPVGVKEPFYWLLKAIVRNRKISHVRTVAMYVALISIVWIITYSIFPIYHFKFLLHRTWNVENDIRQQQMYKGSINNITDDDRKKIYKRYESYSRSWVVGTFFEEFQSPANNISRIYGTLNLSSAGQGLDKVIKLLVGIIRNPSAWPVLNPKTSALDKSEQYNRVVEEIGVFHQPGEEKSPLYARSDRVLAYVNAFEKAIVNPDDLAGWDNIVKLVEHDRAVSGMELNIAEGELMTALSERKIKKAQAATAQQTVGQLGGQMPQVNGNENPAFRLDMAVTLLTQIKENLDPNVSRDTFNMIRSYLESASRWNTRQNFFCKIEKLPGNMHLHFAIAERGKEPTWPKEEQYYEGQTIPLNWKIGDVIYIAADTGSYCKWGVNPSDKKVLTGKYSLFEMEGDITFDDLRKTVSISFQPALKEQLPFLK
ncbi:MAG: hypothetical protein NTV06_06155, partial [candidate division Zixibacteria bacterium]|nr:hypothetical protein [candidate division Zixibacteria bacterium]